jgi:predicted PurR-regulated permease PerM
MSPISIWHIVLPMSLRNWGHSSLSPISNYSVASQFIDCYDRSMLGFDARAARYAWTAICVLLLVCLVYLIRETLFVFIVALLLAYLLYPLVHFLERRIPGRSKIPSLAIVYLLLLGILVMVGIEIGSRIAIQADALSSRIPELLAKLEHPISGVGQGVGLKLLSEIQRQLADHSRDLILPVTNAIMGFLAHAEMLLFAVLVPILSFFFLKDGETLLSALIGFVSEESYRKIINDIASDLHLLLASYMRALVILGLAAAIAYATFFSIIGLPYGLLLGAIAFFFEFIPMVGPLTSAVIVLLVAGLSGFGHLLVIIVFLAAFRLFQDYILSPHLLSSGTELHPLLVIFGVLAGGQIAGIPGAFLSVPVIATLRIVYRQIRKKRILTVSPPEP